MKPINCILIDDEPLARDILERFVKATAALNLVASCKNGLEAMALLKERDDIDLLFLDINMPKLSGIHFLKSLVQPPAVIFTTAYPEFAVDGFELNAVDYLLKPFSLERFQIAVDKVLAKNGKLSATRTETHILIKSNKVLHKVLPNQVQYIEAYGDYVKVFLRDKQLITNSTFSALYAKLASHGFVRTHKSFAINIEQVQKVQGNQVWVDDQPLPIGQKYKRDFLKRIGVN